MAKKITKHYLRSWLAAVDFDVGMAMNAIDKASARIDGINLYVDSLDSLADRIANLEAKAQANAPAKEADHGEA